MTTNAIYSLDAEQAVLGSVLISEDALADCAFLTASDFHVIRHQWLWQAIVDLHQSGQPVDVMTVARRLHDSGHLDECGGAAYLNTLLSAVATHLNAEAYARLVHRDSLRRQALEAAAAIAKLAYDDGLTVEELVTQSAATVSRLRAGDDRDLSPASAMTAAYTDEMERRMSRTADADTLTGLAGLDKIIIGMESGNLVYIASRTGMGKTSLMLQIAAHEARRGRRVAVFSLEMSRHEVMDRLMAMESLISVTDLRTGQIGDMALLTFGAASRVISGLPLYVDDTSNLTPLRLAAKLRRAELLYGPFDLVVVDYVQLMSADRVNGRRYTNRYEEVTEISRNLKVMAGDFRVTMIGGVQMNRAIDQRQDKRPTLSDLRDSGSLEQDANMVMFIHVPDPVVSAEREVIIGKNRQGATGQAPVIFDGPHTRFLDAVTVALE